MSRLIAPLVLLALAAPASAQSLDGMYAVTGADSQLGAYTGRLQVRDLATHYEVIREIRYQQPTAKGPLTTVWIGVGVSRGSELHVTYPLNRMGWITEAGGLTRTAADQQPDPVTGTYRPDPSGGLSVTLSSPGGVSATEAVSRTGSAGNLPIHTDDRTTVPLHKPPPAWVKSLLFSLFSSYHQLPDVAPYAARPEFQDAVHLEVRDRIGHAWLQSRPGELFLLNKRVDAISLAEADVRRSAYGLKLHEKATGYDTAANDRHRNEGILAFGVRDDPTAPGGLDKAADMSSWLWTAAYLYGQSCRYQVTQDPQALANVEAIADRMCDMVAIDTRQGEFARSLRPVGYAPNTGRWHPGTGPFSHLAFHDNGNNDMIKGLWLGFLGAWEVLPQSSPVRQRMLVAVREIADHWVNANPSAAGGTGHKRDRPMTHLMNGMLAFWMTGDPKYEQSYKAQLRKPMVLLELASGGNFAVWGISDWSGNHLGICTKIALLELGKKLNSPWVPLFEQHIRSAYHFLRRYRQTMFSIAAAGLVGNAQAVDEVRWQLREFPFPKPKYAVDRTLDPTFSYSPWPSHPWKGDWTTNAGRKSSLYTYPVFMRNADNYVYRSGPFNKGGGATPWEHPGGDYLFAYWTARRWGVIGGSE